LKFIDLEFIKLSCFNYSRFSFWDSDFSANTYEVMVAYAKIDNARSYGLFKSLVLQIIKSNNVLVDSVILVGLSIICCN
jgi:hypothetical protein